ncbi:hypothetical protein PCURB6_10900 [Paenibacillus curdlanolyticus]|nr:hypothetical protein PCURB6_10900 [Paenibacillus curdlanolyticus]
MTAVLGEPILRAYNRQVWLRHMIRHIVLLALAEEHVEWSDKYIAALILQMRTQREMQLSYNKQVQSCRS